MSSLAVRLADPQGAQWSAEVEQLGALLQAGSNPTTFPAHFLQVVLPRLGGHVAWFYPDYSAEPSPVGVGLLFPRGVQPGSHRANGDVPRAARIYTLRYHALEALMQPVTAAVAQAAIAAIAPALAGAEVIFYDPHAEQQYTSTEQQIGSVSIGHPNATEAAQIPRLNQRIWGSPPASLYPADIHSDAFGSGTSLVARVDGQLAAFLFGFTKFGGPPLPADWASRFQGALRLESQTMGVLPDYRGMRIANILKKVQADQAWQAGMGVLNWTADPLQFPNAALNFGLLRALAFHHYPDLYPFRNELNRVPASRFGLTWLVGSARVQSVPRLGARALLLDLRQHPEIVRVNAGLTVLHEQVDASHLAIEIPADWTKLQQQDGEAAQQWRTLTDALFAHYVGTSAGQFVITGVATDGEARFLIGQQVNDALWTHLGHVASQVT